jgi:hypothetical protein
VLVVRLAEVLLVQIRNWFGRYFVLLAAIAVFVVSSAWQ